MPYWLQEHAYQREHCGGSSQYRFCDQPTTKSIETHAIADLYNGLAKRSVKLQTRASPRTEPRAAFVARPTSNNQRQQPSQRSSTRTRSAGGGGSTRVSAHEPHIFHRRATTTSVAPVTRAAARRATSITAAAAAAAAVGGAAAAAPSHTDPAAATPTPTPKRLRRRPLHPSPWLNAPSVVTERTLVVRERFDLDSPFTRPPLPAGCKVYLLQSRPLPSGDVRCLIAESPVAGMQPLGWVTMVKDGQRLLSSCEHAAGPVVASAPPPPPALRDAPSRTRSQPADYLAGYRSVRAAVLVS
jgi:hypothetical protein